MNQNYRIIEYSRYSLVKVRLLRPCTGVFWHSLRWLSKRSDICVAWEMKGKNGLRLWKVTGRTNGRVKYSSGKTTTVTHGVHFSLSSLSDIWWLFISRSVKGHSYYDNIRTSDSLGKIFRVYGWDISGRVSDIKVGIKVTTRDEKGRLVGI